MGPPPITRGGGGSALGASSAAYGATSYGTSLYNRTADHYDPQSPNRGYDSHLYSTSRDDSPGAGRAGLGYSPLRDSYESPGRPGASGAGGGGGGGSAGYSDWPMELSPTESPILSPAASPHRPAGGSGYGWQC